MSASAFDPDWVSPPGETIVDLMSRRGLEPDLFAEQMGTEADTANRLVSGLEEITPSLASKLEEVLGPPASFWISRELNYRNALVEVRQSEKPQGEEWLRMLPVNDMVKRRWVAADEGGDVRTACLAFFDVTSEQSWHSAYSEVLAAVAFRTSATFHSTPGAVAAWLRRGENIARSINSRPWDAVGLQRSIPEMKKLTRTKGLAKVLTNLNEICNAFGVAVVVVRPPERCCASGAARFLDDDKALIQLSLRHLTDDHFWFTFFHELAHLLLHTKDIQLFIDGDKEDMFTTEREHEANQMASEILIAPELEGQLRSLKVNSHQATKEIVTFARLAGISAGIVVGQLQHRGLIEFSRLNSFKRRFTHEEAEALNATL